MSDRASFEVRGDEVIIFYEGVYDTWKPSPAEARKLSADLLAYAHGKEPEPGAPANLLQRLDKLDVVYRAAKQMLDLMGPPPVPETPKPIREAYARLRDALIEAGR